MNEAENATRPTTRLGWHRSAVAFLLTAAMLVGCAHVPPPDTQGDSHHGFGDPAAAAVSLSEPAASEVAIVLNLNATIGNHAGMFVGSRLSDPAGSYLSVRAEESDWQGPSLQDYIRFQQDDGYRIHVYRFKLAKADIDAIVARIVDFGPHMPLFCAADVQNQIAGIGPFAAVKQVWWTSPAALGDELSRLVNHPLAKGACVWPDGILCRTAIQPSECEGCVLQSVRIPSANR
jgi:hypothetical protein